MIRIARSVAFVSVLALALPAAAAPPPPAPFQAALFEVGRTFAYTVTVEVAEFPEDGGEPVWVEHDCRRTCRVASARDVGDARVSEVACEKPACPAAELFDTAVTATGRPPAAGFFVATARGLWLTDEAPDDAAAVAALTKAPPHLPARPAAGQRKLSGDEAGTFLRDVRAQRWQPPEGKAVDGWCFRDHCDDCGDPSYEEWCFGSGFGVTSASFLFSTAALGSPGAAQLVATTAPAVAPVPPPPPTAPTPR